MWGVLLGLALAGGLVGWYFYLQIRRDLARLEEDKLQLNQEKQIVLEFMHNLAEAIGEGVTREELFRRVVHAAVLSTGALSAAVFERTGEESLQGRAAEGLFPPQKPIPESVREKLTSRAKFLEQVLRAETLSFGEGILGSVARSGQGVLVTDGEHDPRIVRHHDDALAVRSLIAAPMTFRDRLMGVLAVANPSDGLSFTETDFSLVQSLAEQAALAIHNLDLLALQIERNRLDLDLELASTIQGMLLPRQFPQDPRLDIAAWYRPAQKVGGDLYDVFPLPEGRIGIAVADVSGKGIPASLLMAICQSHLRHVARAEASPAKVLGALNAELATDLRRDMFITLIYAVIDPAAGEIVVARAGHELPLLLAKDTATGLTEARQIGSEGMALGMAPPPLFNAVIAERRVPFRPGEVLVLYTDGVTEAVNAEGTEFSSARLADAVREARHTSAAQINEAVVAAVEEFSDHGPQADDLTLLTVRFRESPPA